MGALGGEVLSMGMGTHAWAYGCIGLWGWVHPEY